MMNVGAIDSSRIEAMLAQLKAAASQKPAATAAMAGQSALTKTTSANKVDFAEALKSSLNQVNSQQLEAQKLGQNFSMGDDKVSLSDVMIAGQKANISFQATVQVRNKLVSAYHDILNMQI